MPACRAKNEMVLEQVHRGRSGQSHPHRFRLRLLLPCKFVTSETEVTPSSLSPQIGTSGFCFAQSRSELLAWTGRSREMSWRLSPTLSLTTVTSLVVTLLFRDMPSILRRQDSTLVPRSSAGEQCDQLRPPVRAWHSPSC